jgi:hypothetical protein
MMGFRVKEFGIGNAECGTRNACKGIGHSAERIGLKTKVLASGLWSLVKASIGDLLDG